MKNTANSGMILAAVFLATCEFGFAQMTSGDGIQSQGEVVLERKPEVMRMSVDLMAKGKNMSDAIAKLKARRAKVEQQLVTLGAAKDSWKFGEMHVDKLQNDQRKQMQMMVRQRMGQKRGKPAKGKAAAAPTPPVDLSMNLTAEWLLKSVDTSEQLAATHKLQEAIKSADLGGAKDAEELSDEQAEMDEEMDDFGGNFGNPNEAKPGEPAFVFVSKISPEDRQKAMNEAFLDAKTDAVRLAKAAELELGSLRSLNSSGGMDDAEQLDQYNYRSGVASFMRRQMGGYGNNTHTNEAVGLSAGLLKYKVTVYAAFAFK